MDAKKVQTAISYWFATAAHDYDTMRSLFQSARYSDCLFYGHIVLEKVLKAHIVAMINDDPPRIHDLVRLAKEANLQLPRRDADLLNAINDFNLRARYPDYKLVFYKKCNKAYTNRYFQKISTLYQKLCQKQTQKK